LTTQTHTAPEAYTREQFRLSLTAYFIPALPALGILASAVTCAGLAAFNFRNQPLPAFLLCAFLTGLGFLAMVLALKREQQRHATVLLTITKTCQKAMGEEDTARVQLPESDTTQNEQVSAQIFNRLLDSYTYLRKDARARRQDLAYLRDQMELLLYEMQPVADGDLRTRSTVEGDTLGSVAAMCNALVEDTAQLIQWTQYMADQIIQTSHGLMEQSLEIARITETFATQHEATTRTIETLLAFTLQMESALFSNVEMLREHWKLLHKPGKARDALISDQPAGVHELALLELFQDIPQQLKLLENILQKAHETTVFAENTIKELHYVGQHFHHIDGVVVQFASIINALTTLADSWRQTAENYILPTSEEARERFVETIPALISS
jgi:hypothetical protein